MPEPMVHDIYSKHYDEVRSNGKVGTLIYSEGAGFNPYGERGMTAAALGVEDARYENELLDRETLEAKVDAYSGPEKPEEPNAEPEAYGVYCKFYALALGASNLGKSDRTYYAGNPNGAMETYSDRGNRAADVGIEGAKNGQPLKTKPDFLSLL